jgi:hypothetical protein
MEIFVAHTACDTENCTRRVSGSASKNGCSASRRAQDEGDEDDEE